MVKIMMIIGIIIGVLGVLVIRSLNPIHSVLYLVTLFGGISVLLVLLGMEFVGLTYLIVYVGAIAILFLFVIMMLNIRLIELEVLATESNITNLLLAGVVLSTITIIKGAIEEGSSFSPNTNVQSNEVGRVLIEGGDWESMIIKSSNIEIIGEMLYGNYSTITLLTSIVLLMVMVGVIVLVRG